MTESAQTEMSFDNPCMTREAMADYLNTGISPVRVKFNRNRVTMVSVAFQPDGGIDLRIHQDFLTAPAEVRKALRTYLHTRRRAAWAVVTDYASRIETPGRAAGDAAAARRRRRAAAGLVFDLEKVRKEVNREFFNGRVKCSVEWGRASSARGATRSSSIRYGSWHSDSRTIRVNPRLDDPKVPSEFIRYIVFHEMLHAVVPARKSGSRTVYHTDQFRTLEKAFPQINLMKRLCSELIDVL
jgi:predicted SprT family Zn-dependent metalloprotease